jgi:hypothetical protein
MRRARARASLIIHLSHDLQGTNQEPLTIDAGFAGAKIGTDIGERSLGKVLHHRRVFLRKPQLGQIKGSLAANPARQVLVSLDLRGEIDGAAHIPESALDTAELELGLGLA